MICLFVEVKAGDAVLGRADRHGKRTLDVDPALRVPELPDVEAVLRHAVQLEQADGGRHLAVLRNAGIAEGGEDFRCIVNSRVPVG